MSYFTLQINGDNIFIKKAMLVNFSGYPYISPYLNFRLGNSFYSFIYTNLSVIGRDLDWFIWNGMLGNFLSDFQAEYGTTEVFRKYHVGGRWFGFGFFFVTVYQQVVNYLKSQFCIIWIITFFLFFTEWLFH